MLVMAFLACSGDKRISANRANINSSAPTPSPMLKKRDRVKIFAHTGKIIDFIPSGSGDNLLAAVVQTDEEIIFEGVHGNIVIMRLRYVGAQWGADGDVNHIVGADLCPNGPHYSDVVSWFKNAACVQLDWGLTYEVL